MKTNQYQRAVRVAENLGLAIVSEAEWDRRRRQCWTCGDRICCWYEQCQQKWKAVKKRLMNAERFTEVEVRELAERGDLKGEARAAFEEWQRVVRIYGEKVDTTPHWEPVEVVAADLVIVDE